MKVTKNLILILTAMLFLNACSVLKESGDKTNQDACLSLYLPNHNHINFNSKYLASHHIQKIIEREYLHKKDKKTDLVNIIYFNHQGYITSKLNGKANPETDKPNEKDIFSRWDYSYQPKDSFLIKKSKITLYYLQNKKLPKPFIRDVGINILNIKNAKFYRDDDRGIKQQYQYDEKNRLIALIDSEGKALYRLNYLPNNTLEIKSYDSEKQAYIKSLIRYNQKGQVISTYNEATTDTSEFFYNKRGEMIEEKTYFKNQEPIYYLYEYVKFQ